MDWKSIFAANRESYLQEFVELLSIPSVSTDESKVGDVLAAGNWVATRLKKAGIENVEVIPTGPHSCVYGDYLHAPGKPTILIYGHFDVQPPEPLELWDSPAFEPVVKDGKIYARGATDMKGNLLIAVHAVEEMLRQTGSLPVNVKFIFEGQEEIGSRDLGPFVAANHEKLSCDLIVSADGLQWAADRPCLWMATKGMCGLQIDIETADMDLHSGLYGGAVPNALHQLVELLSTLRNYEGRILVDGFYDQVRELTSAEREAFAQVPFDEAKYKASIGIDDLVGEAGFSTYERAWARPTLELNGVWGGYRGDGVKTVIPAKAHAKITCRLVANQEPDDVLASIESHLEKHKPAGVRMTITRAAGKARPYEMPMDHPGVMIAGNVLREVYGTDPYFVRIGGSLPITDMFLQELGAYTVSVGFGLDDERAHSPNEFMRLDAYERGHTVSARLLEELASF